MDLYSHNDSNIIYVTENVLGPVANDKEFETLEDNFNSQISSFCTCQDCCLESCPCVLKSGGSNYVSNSEGNFLDMAKFASVIAYPFFECNHLCTCINCSNRVVQNGPAIGLEVKPCDTELKGMGLFTNQSLLHGTFICEYAGEVITRKQAMQRHMLNSQVGKMNYIFCLIEHSGTGATQTIIDPSEFGNIGRYINHSCEPNSAIIPVRVDSLIPKLAIFAVVDIKANEEITFNYGKDSHGNIESINKVVRKICLCGSKHCKGFMPFEYY